MNAAEELEMVNADLAWWENRLAGSGCCVHGWTYRNSALISLPSGAMLSIGRKELELFDAGGAAARTAIT